MQIALDTDIVDIETKKGGIAYYTQHLADSLTNPDGDVGLLHYEKKGNPMYDAKEYQYELPKWSRAPSSLRKRAFKRAFVNEAEVRPKFAEEVDVVHIPFKDPFTLPLFFTNSYKTVLTIHDLIHFREDHEFETDNLKSRVFRRTWNGVIRTFLRVIADRVDCFVVGTETVKKNLQKYLSISEERIEVVPYGIPEQFEPQSPSDYPDGVTEPYILSNISPHPEIFDVYRELCERKIDHDLVLFGRESNFEKHEPYIEELGIRDHVTFTGYVSTEELIDLYSGADVYFGWEKGTYGFGLTNIEAMACGTPVVTTDEGAISEAVGDAALLADPDDLEQLCANLEELLTNDDFYEEMTDAALKRSNRYSYAKTARKMREIYARLAAE